MFDKFAYKKNKHLGAFEIFQFEFYLNLHLIAIETKKLKVKIFF